MSKEIEEKINRYKKFLDNDPLNIQLKLDIADLYLKINDKETASFYLTELAEEPLTLDECCHLGNLLLKAGNTEQAIIILESLFEHHEDDVGIALGLAYAYFQSKEYNEALDLIECGIFEQVDQLTAQFYLLKARCYHALSETEAALEILDEAVKTHPDNYDIFGMISLLYCDQGQIEKAVALAKQVILQNESQQEALLVLNYASIQDQSIETAKQQAENLIKLNPENGRAWMNLGLSYMLDNHLNEALQAIEKAVEYMPDFIGLWHTKGWCELLSKNTEKAKESFISAFELDRNFAESHGNLAVIAALEKDQEKATYYITRAKRLNPDNFAGNYADILLLHQKSPELAEQKLKTLIKKLPLKEGQNFEQLISSLAQHHAAKNNLQAGVTHFKS